MSNDGVIVFQLLAGTQPRNGDVLLPVIGINRRLALKWNAEVLNRVGGCGHDRAICFVHTHVGDLNPLVGGVIPNYKLSPGLHTRFTLHLDSSANLVATGSIVFKSVGVLISFDNVCLLRMVRHRRSQLRLNRWRNRQRHGWWRRLRQHGAGNKRKGKNETAQHIYCAVCTVLCGWMQVTDVG